jgi:hypothetical protein
LGVFLAPGCSWLFPHNNRGWPTWRNLLFLPSFASIYRTIAFWYFDRTSAWPKGPKCWWKYLFPIPIRLLHTQEKEKEKKKSLTRLRWESSPSQHSIYRHQVKNRVENQNYKK